MLTQGKIDKFYLDVNSLDIKKKVSVITRETEFPQSNVSEWLRRVKRPSEAFINKFYEKFGHMTKASTKNLQSDLVNDYEKDDRLEYIELKTASGKTIQVKPEGQREITLLNAFLEERDRVIETIKEEKQARIEELKKDKEDLTQMLNSTLAKIYSGQQLALAYQKAWVDYEAEKVAKGDQNKKKEIQYKMGKLVDGIIQNDASKGIPDEIDKRHKEE